MKDHEEEQAKKTWNNGKIPVILRRGGGEALRLRLPMPEGAKAWLQKKPRNRKPIWNPVKRYWELPASRFNDLVEMMLRRFGSIYIIQPYREKEVCARACMEAHGFECQCSCMGVHHGSGSGSGWYEVSDSFAVLYGERRLACRLVKTT